MAPALAESPIVYPSPEVQTNGTSYSYLPEEVSRYVEGLFMRVRNS